MRKRANTVSLTRSKARAKASVAANKNATIAGASGVINMPPIAVSSFRTLSHSDRHRRYRRSDAIPPGNGPDTAGFRSRASSPLRGAGGVVLSRECSELASINALCRCAARVFCRPLCWVRRACLRASVRRTRQQCGRSGIFVRKLVLLVALVVAPPPFLLGAIPQTAIGPGSGHGYLIDKHIRPGLDCASCHRNAPPPEAPEMSICTGCRGSYSQIAAKTASDQPNPHASHLGEIPCAACHHVHRASETLCDECHTFGMKPP